MNERIKELHKQAFDWVQYQLQTVGSDHPVTQKEQMEMVNQKFAELIVRECAEVASAPLAFTDAAYCRIDLLKHFGIQE
jgi:hypothetical protein